VKITPINALAGLRVALTAPPADRIPVFAREVIDPLRPFWEGWLRWQPQPTPISEMTPIDVARSSRFYHPELDCDRGLAALDQLDHARVWPTCLDALERAASILRPDAHGITLDEARFAFVLGDPSALDEKNDMYTGVGNVPGALLIMAWPTPFNLPRFPAIAVHELNHNVRFLYEPWSLRTTVGKYLVDEGVAECFAAELYGEEMLGRWTTRLTIAEVEALRPRYREAIDVTGFDEIRGYIFGDWAADAMRYTRQGLPDFAGYAFGYRMVRAFLARTGTSAADATYLPWQQIVDESHYLA
jgi:uncharacterized protein YjaZ